MLVDFSKVLIDVRGNPIKEKNEDKESDMTLGSAVIAAASVATHGLTPAISLKRFKLAVAAGKVEPQELDDDLLEELRKAIFQRFSGHPMVYGRVCEIVGEPKIEPKKVPKNIMSQATIPSSRRPNAQ